MLTKAKRNFDVQAMNNASYYALDRAGKLLDTADRFRNDTNQVKRLAEHLCKCCFYICHNRVAGQSITVAPCASCGKEVTYSSTATDDLCLDCAKKHKACKRCCADMNLRKRRKV